MPPRASKVAQSAEYGIPWRQARKLGCAAVLGATSDFALSNDGDMAGPNDFEYLSEALDALDRLYDGESGAAEVQAILHMAGLVLSDGTLGGQISEVADQLNERIRSVHPAELGNQAVLEVTDEVRGAIADAWSQAYLLQPEWDPVRDRPVASESAWKAVKETLKPGDRVRGTILTHHGFGMLIDIGHPALGIIYASRIKEDGAPSGMDSYPAIGSTVNAVVVSFDDIPRRVRLSMRQSDGAATRSVE
jgi:hypothetical protein